ncbi:MAG: serine acetyltransferase [Bacteroidaceae bacterium]|nr:serine acetyltransferase [Bacteroidaceae bacterium]
MLGNSLTENGRDWCVLLEDSTVCNRGISGDTAGGITERLNQILPGKPRAIFLMCGTNDISHGHSAEKVFYMCKSLIDTIRITSPETRLFVQSILPWNDSFNRWKNLVGRSDDVPVINNLLRSYCEEEDITFINLYPKFTLGDTNQMVKEYTADGLHLTPLGYQIWSSQLKPYIQELNQPQHNP